VVIFSLWATILNQNRSTAVVCRIVKTAMELALSVNGSSTSLLFSAPVLTVPYISVISLASVVGTLGNLLVIGSLGGSVRCRNPRTVGKIFIVNLACSDLIVTSVINPMAIAGMRRTAMRGTR